MKTREEILNTLAHNKPAWQKRYKVQKLAIFGSYARGDQTAQSDVDVLVEVDPSIGLGFVSLAEEIETSLGIHIDLISKRAINPRNWHMIKQEVIYV